MNRLLRYSLRPLRLVNCVFNSNAQKIGSLLHGPEKKVFYSWTQASSFHVSSSLYFPDDLSEIEFEKHCNETLESLCDFFEFLIEENDILKGADVTYSDGVLTLTLGEKGTYVINRQSPNKQIWLSSPMSGPKRYDLVNKSQWIYKHDQNSLQDLLQAELTQILGKEILIPQKDVRECYSQLQQVNDDLLRIYALRCANHNDLLNTLRNINTIIQQASRLRVGKLKGEIASLCRSALATNNVNGLIRVIKTGVP